MSPEVSATAHGHDAHGHGEGQPHATWQAYALIGVILAIITAVEVAIFYIEALESVLVPLLVILSAGKFFLVVLYYMHLKFDHAVFGRVFWAPMVLAVLVVIGMVLLFQVLPDFGKFSD
jgi:cytochrome c oxidase subunit IV